MDEWHPDIHIDEAFVKMCLARHFPGLSSLNSIQCIGEGWNNKVFLIDNTIVFKFPHRKSTAELIAREKLVLNKLPQFQDIKLPIPKYIGHFETDYLYSFRGYDLIVGTPAYQLQFTEQEHLDSLIDLALFLKQLHHFDEKQALALGAIPQTWDRTNIQKLTNEMLERIDKINERKICKINIISFEEEINKICNISFAKNDKCLVHGDLDLRHLLFDNKKLAGIIDWDEMGINNRSIDLGVIWSFYPHCYHEIFFKHYGPVEEHTWQYARFLALCNAMTLLLYGNGKKDLQLVEKSKEVIKRIRPDLI